MDDLIKLALDGDWDAVINRLSSESPLTLDRFVTEYCNRTDCDDFGDNFTEEQRKAFTMLSSSDRRVEYYKHIPVEKMTAEEYSDFKSSSW